MKVITAGYVESIGTLKDGSIKFSISTQEMDGEQCAKVFEFRNKYVKVLVSDDDIRQMDEEKVSQLKLAAPSKKTPSQRLRAVIYRVWETRSSGMDFEQFYASEMEGIIDSFKLELE